MKRRSKIFSRFVMAAVLLWGMFLAAHSLHDLIHHHEDEHSQCLLGECVGKAIASPEPMATEVACPRESFDRVVSSVALPHLPVAISRGRSPPASFTI